MVYFNIILIRLNTFKDIIMCNLLHTCTYKYVVYEYYFISSLVSIFNKYNLCIYGIF